MAFTTLDSAGGGPARKITEGLTTRSVDWRGKLVEGLLILTLLITLLILGVLIFDTVQRGWPIWTDRPADFLSGGLNTSSAAIAGVSSAIRGTVILALIVALLAFPLGIACAVYLEEYAGNGVFARWTRVNVRNLAGVPSVVYGLLGLGIFIKVLNTVGGNPADTMQQSRFILFRWIGNVMNLVGGNGGRNIFAGGLALSALVLPLVVITATEALRAVPRSIREGALGVGATPWETIRHHVVPAAAPGILTGTVLSLARAAGEAAPILIAGATTGTLITGNKDFFEELAGPYTALPVAIYSYARNPGDDFRATTGAAALVLLVLVLMMNGIAIALRNRYDRKW